MANNMAISVTPMKLGVSVLTDMLALGCAIKIMRSITRLLNSQWAYHKCKYETLALVCSTLFSSCMPLCKHTNMGLCPTRPFALVHTIHHFNVVLPTFLEQWGDKLNIITTTSSVVYRWHLPSIYLIISSSCILNYKHMTLKHWYAQKYLPLAY
jgi:hypothetical protein